VNQRVRCQTGRAVANPKRRHRGASLDVNDDYFAIGRNQYRHRITSGRRTSEQNDNRGACCYFGDLAVGFDKP
jgi:hypothetical protein